MNFNKIRKSIILASVFMLTLTACGLIQETETPETEPVMVIVDTGVSATGIIVPEKFTALSVSIPGIVDEILVFEGQTVAKGQELMTLSELAQYEAVLAAAQFELTSAQQAYDDFVHTGGLGQAVAWQEFMDAQVVRAEAEREWENLNIDDIEESIEDLKADVKELMEDMNDAQEEFDKYSDLHEDTAKRKDAEDALEDALEEYNEAVRDLEEVIRERDTIRAALDFALAAEAEARRKYELTLDGLNPEQLALLEARLANAMAQVKAAQTHLDNLSLLAPFAGVVADLKVNPGEWASPGLPVLIIADLNSLRIETTDLNEIDVVRIEIGDTAKVTFDAIPDEVFDGTVTEISPKASEGMGVNYTVIVALDEIPEKAKWGMTVFVDIDVE